MSKTRKYIRIMCVILSVAALLTSAAGCSRKSNKNEKVLKQIINNPDSYPQLSFAEFNTLINGKTGLSAAELPRDKASSRAISIRKSRIRACTHSAILKTAASLMKFTDFKNFRIS